MAHSAETKARIAAKVAQYYADHPEARQHQKNLHKAAWDPNTPQGKAKRETASRRTREAQAQARKNAIDAEINRRILEGILAPTGAVEADAAEGGALDA